MLYADLHVHSMYSDGTMTIEEILEEADKQQVGLLAVSDHDMLDGARALQKLAKENEKYKNIKCIPSVEINALDGERNVHILGFYVDLQNKEFDSFDVRCQTVLYIQKRYFY